MNVKKGLATFWLLALLTTIKIGSVITLYYVNTTIHTLLQHATEYTDKRT